jgi:hypothetical protein
VKRTETANCEICSHSSSYFATALLRKGHEIRYYQCGNCGFTQTEPPYWLEDSYSNAITSSDVGLVGRNLALSRKTRALIWAFFDPDARFLDYGGGYGLFVRLMRDSGFDFYLFEERCRNLFAGGFDARVQGQGPYEIVTAFEVFEHFVHPLHEIEKILRFSTNILLTTQLIPSHNPKPDQWWYYGLDHGQHVSFYTIRSLSAIAAHFGLNLVSDGSSMHLLSKKQIQPALFMLFAKPAGAAVVSFLARRRSLLHRDYFKITGRALE